MKTKHLLSKRLPLMQKAAETLHIRIMHFGWLSELNVIREVLLVNKFIGVDSNLLPRNSNLLVVGSIACQEGMRKCGAYPSGTYGK
jgi:hypothetical protein